MKLPNALTVATAMAQAVAMSIGGEQMHVERGSEGLQDIITYDEHSLFVYGERIFVFSGEFHPYRLPVPDLWYDVFQKIKALGFNAVSFYVHWALLEGQPGSYLAEGIFAFEPFFESAKKAGVFLIARPGPYINAESSGGGFPGWLQRIRGQLRTRAPDFLQATDNYAANIGATIAKAQITNGGPVILFQPENEYTGSSGEITGGFPDPIYFAYVKKQFRDAGIIVPFINNDASPQGIFAPGYVVNGTTEGNADIYGHDNYPLGFDCANFDVWPAGNLPTNFHAKHEKQSPSTFYSLNEFQGGSFDPWGGLGFDQCSKLLNHEFERVFYKNDFASGVTLLNIYMIYGGTNWGNLGHAGGYTSYDYGAAISESREVHREKYSELKLESQFLKVSPEYLTASVGGLDTNLYATNSAISVTPLWGNGSATNFYVVRHSDYQSRAPSTYKFNFQTSRGNVTVPQLGGSLILSGRDSKWHVTDYNIGDTILLYSTAEIFTWKVVGNKTFLVLYGGPGELHELSVITESEANVIEGTAMTTKTLNGTAILNWETSPDRRIVQIGDLLVYILDRNAAYNFWVADFIRNDEWGAYSTSINKTTSVIVQAGYLVRSIRIQGAALYVTGDINATSPIRIIGAPANIRSLTWNENELQFTTDLVTSEISSEITYDKPEIIIPDMLSLEWKYIDDLPEIQPTYDDSSWTLASYQQTNNTIQPLRTPVSLFGSDYGFNTGVLIYRGHFVAEGGESQFSLNSQGGSGYGSSVFLNSTYLGSWAGIDAASNNNSTYALPDLVRGKNYVLTILVDNNGLDQNWVVGPDQMKNPRGILDFSLDGKDKTAVTWKLTGNLGGEAYFDKVRGPLNEGGLYAERQGFTQPFPPNQDWLARNPEIGINRAGVGFYQASFILDLPKKYDIPLAFKFGNTTMDGAVARYRAQLWVNGYQFGKYVNNIGPQSSFPVPQGILNYNGRNWLALEIWAQQANGGHLTNFTLEAGHPVLTALEAPALAPMPSYSKRPGAY